MKIFKTSIIAAIALLVSLTAKAQLSLTTEEVSAPKGSIINLPINLENGTEMIKGIQFDLALPEGVKIAGGPTVTDRGEGFTASYDGVRFYIFNTNSSNAYLKGESGSVMLVPLQLDGEAGTYEIGITKVKMTKVGATDDSYAPDFTAKLTIDGELEDYQFYAQDIVVKEGENKATLSICLETPGTVKEFSFDLSMPEGVKVNQYTYYDEDEEDDVTVTDIKYSSRLAVHPKYSINGSTVVFTWNNGGQTSNNIAKDGTGNLITITLDVNANAGEHEIKIANQKVVRGSTTYNASDFTVKLTVKGDAPAVAPYTHTATGDYQTLSLSYDAVVPNGVSVYTAELEGTWVVLTKQESDVLPKNTGVVVKADEGEYLFEAAEEGEYELTGSNILLPTGDEGMAMGDDVEYAYVLAKVNGAAAKFYRYKDFLPANKAYFGWTSSASAPAYINIKRDEATGINAAAEDGKAEYYDLSGRRAGSASRGLLIQKTENGNRVTIKK